MDGRESPGCAERDGVVIAVVGVGIAVVGIGLVTIRFEPGYELFRESGTTRLSRLGLIGVESRPATRVSCRVSDRATGGLES